MKDVDVVDRPGADLGSAFLLTGPQQQQQQQLSPPVSTHSPVLRKTHSQPHPAAAAGAPATAPVAGASAAAGGLSSAAASFHPRAQSIPTGAMGVMAADRLKADEPKSRSKSGSPRQVRIAVQRSGVRPSVRPPDSRHSSPETHTHTRLTALFSGTTRMGRYQKGKTKLDFTEARDSEWQWHQLGICKSTPRSRQITTPAPHHSVFYRPDALPATQPTASRHRRHRNQEDIYPHF